MELNDKLKRTIDHAAHIALNDRCKYLCPEHILLALLLDKQFISSVLPSAKEAPEMFKKLRAYLDQQNTVPMQRRYELAGSSQMNLMMSIAFQLAQNASAPAVGLSHVICSLSQLHNSVAATTLLKPFLNDRSALINSVVQAYGIADSKPQQHTTTVIEEKEEEAAPWQQFVTAMNPAASERDRLVGRKQEMERTLQVLCRRSCNNALLVGEPGVGKSALAWGLVQNIVQGKVPRRLKKTNVFQLNIGSLLAGAQFRSDVEKRLGLVMNGLETQGNSILFIDELHTLVGAGQNNDNGMDAAQFLRPYLEKNRIPVIAATTHRGLERKLGKHPEMLHCFQQIDVPEPSDQETLDILRALAPRYADFHGVEFPEEVLSDAIALSKQHITGRCLPDKALDLLDEAGAWRELHPRRGTQVVDKALLEQTVARMTKKKAEVLRSESNRQLQTLTQRMQAAIYGQDEAVRQVVQSVEMAKAGLLDEDKPMASLLFVGPTGVGKTEVARVLAKELGVELVRFDMSEYTEKHTVSKLIGSPAGYVGYDDGGLLTDAIRRAPNCVLLLDEIEKAHPEVYNILLQVMDYASLTDNRGQKADFRQTIIIMTSNAGAQYAGQAAVGFAGGTSKGDAMLAQVKRTFKPEFINRLSGTVVFREMDRQMATLILDKKIKQLQEKLKRRNVKMTLTRDAHTHLLNQGFTQQYGAREMDRVIRQQLTPLLMNEILYGALQEGGKAKVTLRDGALALA